MLQTRSLGDGSLAATLDLLQSHGFEPYAEQYEMTKTLGAVPTLHGEC